MKRFSLPVVKVSLFSAGCASTPANLQRETAGFIGDISPEQVTVSDVQYGMTDVKWKAQTPKGRYSCSAGDSYGAPIVSKNKGVSMKHLIRVNQVIRIIELNGW